MIIFPCDPLNSKKVDPDFINEFDAATNISFNTLLFDFDLFIKTNELKITNRFIYTDTNTEYSVLRSWMFTLDKYEKIYRLFHSNGINLINSPSQYKNAHYFPYIYPYIKDYTPDITWINKEDLYNDKSIVKLTLKDKTKNIGKYFIIKDFAKSNKIGSKIEKYKVNIDLDELYSVVEEFIKDRKLYGNFYGGIVFKKYIELRKYNGKVNEWRLFILDNKIITYNLNSNVNSKNLNKPNIDFYQNIIKKIPINFYTIDVAELSDGNWTIIEAGDAQVSGLAIKQNSIDLINNLKTFL